LQEEAQVEPARFLAFWIDDGGQFADVGGLSLVFSALPRLPVSLIKLRLFHHRARQVAAPQLRALAAGI
jgi:hypothetical protein